MRCAVKNCGKNNKIKPCNISFFSFPLDPALQKQWKAFCGRDKNINIKRSNICMEHFKADDFENSLEYDMGFTKRRFLKKGAVPTIKKTKGTNAILFEERAKRIEKRENRKTVEMLLKSNVTSDTVDDEKICEPLAQTNETVGIVEDSTDEIMSIENQCFANIEINRLNMELEYLRKENTELKMSHKKIISKLNAVIAKAAKEAKINKQNVNNLKTRLNKCNYELKSLQEKLLDIFTKEQIIKIKTEVEQS